MKPLSLVKISLIILILISCQKNDDEAPQPPANNNGTDTRHVVQMVGNSFSPQNLEINLGDTVVWTNAGTMVHTSTSGTNCNSDGTWNSGNLNPGDSFSFIFNDEGSFDYFCIPHCQMGMVGNVTVVNEQ